MKDLLSRGLFIIFMSVLTACSSEKTTQVERDCENDPEKSKCLTNEDYYVARRIEKSSYALCKPHEPPANWIAEICVRETKELSKVMGRWVGQKKQATSVKSIAEIHPALEDEGFIRLWALPKNITNELNERSFRISGAVRKVRVEPYEAMGGTQDPVIGVVLGQRQLLASFYRWEFGSTDTEALLYCDRDELSYFESLGDFTCEAEFIVSFQKSSLGIDWTLDAYKIKEKSYADWYAVHKKIEGKKARQYFKRHQAQYTE